MNERLPGSAAVPAVIFASFHEMKGSGMAELVAIFKKDGN
jgi:hypothetical protein